MSWRDLERRAAALDRLATRERTAGNLAEEATLRRRLLVDLDEVGVLDAVVEPPAGLPVVAGYHRAASRLGHYLRSVERARFNPDAAPTYLLGAPVSVDWFRIPSPTPGHLSDLEWLAYLENVLTSADPSGDRGEIFVHIGDGWWTLHWRTDDGVHPAVVSAGTGEAEVATGA
jgi:hypothetical protein